MLRGERGKYMDIPEINIPDNVGEEAATRISVGDAEYILIVLMEFDQFAEHPSSRDDAFGTFHSLGRRHSNFNKECAELLQPDGDWDGTPFNEDGSLIYSETDAVPLSYFEHGACVWSPYGEGPKCQFDSVAFAGVWVPSEILVEQIDKEGLKGDERYKRLVDECRRECEVWTKWCNGNIFFLDSRLYLVNPADYDEYGDPRDDSRYYSHRTDLLEDSCLRWGGLYDDVDIKAYIEEVRSGVDGVLSDVAKCATTSG